MTGYDWTDLERSSDLARQHKHPDGRPWRCTQRGRFHDRCRRLWKAAAEAAANHQPDRK